MIAQDYVILAGAEICPGGEIFYDISEPGGDPDCLVNLYDFAEFAVLWLDSYELADFADFAAHWLDSNLVYPEVA